MTNKKQKIGLTATVKASKQETKDFITYHYNIGIDYFYIFFDDPYDQVITEINLPNVKCIKCDKEHWISLGCTKDDSIEKRQVKNADLALKWAKQDKVDWITHIDSDELIYSKRSLSEIISSLNFIDYIVLPPKESVPTKLSYKYPYREINLFKVLPDTMSDNFHLFNNVLFDGEYFRGHTSGKSLSKVSDNIKSLGIHRPIFFDSVNAKYKMIHGLSILHFDCYDVASWCKKWSLRISGEAKATDCRPNRLKQKQFFIKSNENNDTVSLIKAYKKLYFIDNPNKNNLLQAGLLENIYIDKNLFKLSPLNIFLKKFREKL